MKKLTIILLLVGTFIIAILYSLLVLPKSGGGLLSISAGGPTYATLEECQKSIIDRSDNLLANWACLRDNSQSPYSVYYWKKLNEYSGQAAADFYMANRNSVIKMSLDWNYCPEDANNFLVKEKLGACQVVASCNTAVIQNELDVCNSQLALEQDKSAWDKLSEWFSGLFGGKKE